MHLRSCLLCGTLCLSYMGCVCSTCSTSRAGVRTAAQVEDEHAALALGLPGRLLVQAVRDGGRGRLVDDAQHVQARDCAGVLGRLRRQAVQPRLRR